MPSVSSIISCFRRDQRGSVLIIFGFSVLLIVGVVGLAIDGGRAYGASSKLSSAADSAALAGAKLLDDEESTDDDIRTVVNAYFQAYLISNGIHNASVAPLAIAIDRSESSVRVDADVSLPTTFGQLMGTPSIDFDVSSTVVYRIKRVELAMVLDVTGSMNNDGKLDGMKAAAKDVIDTLVNSTDGKNNRVSLVPYSAAVNVDTYRDVVSGGDSLDGCVMERLNDPNRDNDEPSGGSDNFAVEGQLNSPSTGRYTCPPAVLMPLSKDKDLLKSTIDSYGADGWTAGHIGLAFGWNTISPKWSGVFTGDAEPGPYGDNSYIKALILMTDGVFNTSYTAGTSEADQEAESEARTLALCGAMKAQDIRIYAVAFDAPAEAETLLRACASESTTYFSAANSAELMAVFSAITDNLRSMRVSN